MKTTPFDEANYINTAEDVRAYLDVVLEENDLAALYDALGTVARSKGMTAISRETGLSRESLYKSLREGGNPTFATVCKVLDALGLRLSVSPKEAHLATA